MQAVTIPLVSLARLVQEMRNLNVSHPTELICDPRENTKIVNQHYLSMFTSSEREVTPNAIGTDERGRLTSQICGDIFAQYELVLRNACLNVDITRLPEHFESKGMGKLKNRIQQDMLSIVGLVILFCFFLSIVPFKMCSISKSKS